MLERNPSARTTVEEWGQTMPSPEDRQLEHFVGADSYSFAPLFERGSEFEEAVLNTLVGAELDSCGCLLRRSSRLGAEEMGHPCGDAGYQRRS